jgi:hypothetical protein
MSLFTKRHYEWLARWAGAHLTEDQCAALEHALGESEPRFNAAVFIDACNKSRDLNINKWSIRIATLRQGRLRMVAE